MTTDDTREAPSRVRGVLAWLREGYPSGVPPKDYIPLLALLRRRLTEDEVREIAAEIAALEPPPERPAGTATEIGVEITKLTDAVPSEEDIARVESHLTEHHGWPDSA